VYSRAFDYYAAQSLADAHQLIAKYPGAKLLAGGHSLIPMMKLRLAAPEAIIDIGRVPELRGISLAGGALTIGALTTHAELARSADVAKAAPALAEAAAHVGDPAVRNRGTIGGNIAHADPASDLPTVLVALEATITAVGPRGERKIAAADFFTGLMTTDLVENEIVRSISIPAAASAESSAYAKFSHPASRYAVLGAAAAVKVADGVCASVRVAIGGLVPNARRLPSVERAITGKPANQDTFTQAAATTLGDLGSDISGDIFASGEYRRAMAPVYVKRALAAAVARAGG
jgi:aerobic carbon-monoxide dehydrogenase medium subunit